MTAAKASIFSDATRAFGVCEFGEARGGRGSVDLHKSLLLVGGDWGRWYERSREWVGGLLIVLVRGGLGVLSVWSELVCLGRGVVVWVVGGGSGLGWCLVHFWVLENRLVVGGNGGLGLGDCGRWGTQSSGEEA